MVARTLPPGPKGRVVTGNLLSYTADQLGYLTQCARGYGDIVRLRLLNVPAVLLNHPNHIEYVLVKYNRNFIKSRGERHALSHLGGGLLTSEGSFWRRQRRLVQPAFHRTRIEAYGEEMVRSTERTIDLWRDTSPSDLALVRLWTTSSWPAPRRFFAMAAPMIPRPTNPTFSTVPSPSDEAPPLREG